MVHDLVMASLHSAVMAGFMGCEADELSNPKYYGMVNKKGDWYILRDDTTGTSSSSSSSFRYCYGQTDFPTNWTNRASLTYDYPYNIFHVL